MVQQTSSNFQRFMTSFRVRQFTLDTLHRRNHVGAITAGIVAAVTVGVLTGWGWHPSVMLLVFGVTIAAVAR